MADDVKTVVERPPGSGSREGSSLESAITTEEAMALFEARRVWLYAAGLVVIGLGGLALAIGVGGDPLALRLHAGALAATIPPAAWYAITSRDVRHHRQWKVLVFVYVSLVTNATGFYFWGV